MRRSGAALALAALLFVGPPAGAAPKAAASERWETLFDGHSLAGWHVSAASPHSAASAYRSGGRWTVENGAIVGGQDLPGNGGLLVSDASFRDVEVVLEMNNDFGTDSGLFLRSSEAGEAYQAMIDYFPGGTVGGLWGESLPGGLEIRPFAFGATPSTIRPPKSLEMPVSPEEWRRLWRVGAWNEMRVRITGAPPRIETWINGVEILDVTDTETRRREGAIALQVHGGGDTTQLSVRYRNIRAKRLD